MNQAATNSFVVAQRAMHSPATTHRARRGDGYLLRPLYNFYDFFPLALELGYDGKWAELGVARGAGSLRFFKGMPSGAHLFMVDSWAEVDAYQARDGSDNYDATLRTLTDNKISEDRYTIMRMTTIDAAQSLEDGSFDFIYVDASHTYEDVLLDLEAWWSKLRVGGIIAGDDYYNGYVDAAGYTFGVRDAVDVFFQTKNHRVYTTGYSDPRIPSFQQWFVLKCSE